MTEIARRGRTKVGALVTDNVRDCGRDPNAEIDAIDYQKSENFCKECVGGFAGR